MRLAIINMIMCLPLLAVEGGYLSSHPDWQGKSHSKPDAAIRAAERSARSKAIQEQIAELKSRLQTVPAADKMKQLHAALTQVHQNYGWEPKSQRVYGRRSIDPMLKGQNTIPDGLFKAFKQLNDDFKKRDIDLIVLPFAPTPHFAAHTLVEGIGPDNEYYPGWTEMMLQFLQADIEVVDSLTEFRHEAENETLVSWANDFHTGSLGRQIAAQKLADRLQRYDFARELKAHAGRVKIETVEKTGTLLPQRILVVNGAFMKAADYWRQKDPSLGKRGAMAKGPPPADIQAVKGKKGSLYLRPNAPQDVIKALRNRKFNYMNIRGGGGKDLLRTELVMIGDSQLHSAVFGSGLPAFINAAIGGNFRWGSKSWSGFSPPEIYLEVVPNSAVQPRVVVLALLPKYFWFRYDRQGKVMASKYAPRPLPPLQGVQDQLASRSGDKEAKGPLSATVKITKVSTKPTNNPSTLDYDEALMHVAAVVQDGPLKGTEVGLRYWILAEGAWTKADKQVTVGQKMKLTMTPWAQAIAKDGRIGQHQVFNTIGQDLMVPVFWITKGNLSPAKLLP